MVTVSIVASTFVSLTLTPMLASRMPAPDKHGAGIWSWMGDQLERGFDAVLSGLCQAAQALLPLPLRCLSRVSRHGGAPVYELRNDPEGLLPARGHRPAGRSRTRAREDISFEAMSALQGKVAEVFAKSPYVAHVANTVGAAGGPAGGAMNAGRLFVELKPRDQRPPLQKVLADLRRQLAAVPGDQLLHDPGPEPVGRRPLGRQPIPIRGPEPRPDADERVGPEAHRCDERRPRLLHRCQHRPAEQCRSGASGDRPRQGRHPRHHRRRAALPLFMAASAPSRSRPSTRLPTATT